jgi:diguanylate cyclase (GGDEF)-like protein
VSLSATLRKFVRLTFKVNYFLAILAVSSGIVLVVGIFSPPVAFEEGKELKFTYSADETRLLQPSEALKILDSADERTNEVRTLRAEHPFWLLLDLSIDNIQKNTIDLPSRHIQSISYWIYDSSGKNIANGSISRSEYRGNGINKKKAGFSIDLFNYLQTHKILLKIQSSGPARLTANLQKIDALEQSEGFFDRSGGVLFGSLLMIAAFSILISILSRDIIFTLFSAWVVTSLRLASYSAGWDLAWLGFPALEGMPILSRNIPLAAHSLFTTMLFWGIFKREIVRIKATVYIKILFALSLGLVISSIFLSHKDFLPVLWLVVFPSSLALVFLTIHIFVKTDTRNVAAWYGASWIATLAGGLSEVAFAAGFLTSRPTVLSSLGGSVAAALLAGVAIALRLRSERNARLSAQRDKFDVLEKFKDNYNSMPVGLFSMSHDGQVRLYNPAFGVMFGIGPEPQETSNIDFKSLIGEHGLKRLMAATQRGDGNDVEIKVTDPLQGNRWFLSRLSAKESSIEGSIQEITVRKEAEAQLRHLVDHDSLTGLLNRHGLELAMKLAEEEVYRGNPCAVAHVALDRFKLINELYGHSVGDAMLHEMSLRLSTIVRTHDKVARIGDIFVVVFLNCPEISAGRLAERLRESVSETPFNIQGKSLGMTVSIGVVAIDHTMSAVDALAAADRACAEAKLRGRNCVVQLNDKDIVLKRHLEELKVVADLRHRIPTDRYFLEFQPIVSLRAAGSSLSYEVLIRMRDEDGTVVPPGRFIGAAERNGMMSQIDRWVLASTLDWIDSHPDHRESLNFATINLSGASLNDARFVDDIFAMISNHPSAVRKICFEITESVALHDVDATRRFVERVRAYGSQVALDDFGAGYTSFNYLKEIPANFIKIDGSFVKDINLNPANYAITRTIVELTHELGMESIAEWAETADTVTSLLELDVDYAQGFALARPMAKEVVTGAQSCGALVKDPALVALLSKSASPIVNVPRIRGRHPRS